MSTRDDWLTSIEAKEQLRAGDETPDGLVERARNNGLALVSAYTGRDLLAVDAADIDDGLRAAVSLATWFLFEGMAEPPPSFFALIAPYRRFVADD